MKTLSIILAVLIVLFLVFFIYKIFAKCDTKEDAGKGPIKEKEECENSLM